MNHRRGKEFKRAFSERERVAVSDYDPSVFEFRTEKVLHHRKRLFRSNDFHFRIQFRKVVYIRRMIGFHMLDDEIIGFTLAKHFLHVVKPLVRKLRIHSVHYRDCVVDNYVRVIRHSFRHNVLPLE